MSSHKMTNSDPGTPAGTKDAGTEISAAVSPRSGASQPPTTSPRTPSGTGTGNGFLPPAVTPIQPTTSARIGGGLGARSPEIQRALSVQHDYSWYTDNFHLAKANNSIAADNAERRERQRSASYVAAPEGSTDEKEENKVKFGALVSNLENRKPASLDKGEKADDSKG